jgi:hypothetical protein
LNAGWRTFAVEPNQRLAEIARDKGIDVHTGFLDAAGWGGGEFDIVILHHVLEHEYDPKRMLTISAGMLTKLGLMYVEIPTFETPSWNLFGSYWGDLEFPVHLTLLRKSQLLRMLTDLGCWPLEWKTRTLYGETFRAFSHRFPSARGKGGVTIAVFMVVAGIVQSLLAILN